MRKAPLSLTGGPEYGLDDLLGIENPFRGWSRPKNASQLRRAYKKKNYLCWEDGTFEVSTSCTLSTGIILHHHVPGFELCFAICRFGYVEMVKKYVSELQREEK